MSNKAQQSTNHIALVRPRVFFSNPETQSTNPYQETEKPPSEKEIFDLALEEFYGFHRMLVDAGIICTILPGDANCPDHIFPNFLGTHERGKAILYPMMAPNRRAERTADIMSFVNRHYDIHLDLTAEEGSGHALEANASITLDRINKIAFAAISKRTSQELAQKWGGQMGYEVIAFNTALESGLPVYHTDLVMFIGDDFAGVSFEVMTDGQDAVRKAIEKTGKEIIEITADQMNHMCGNALQIIGHQGKKYLVMSTQAYENYRPDQIATFKKYVSDILHAPIPTIEKYGGGSARCLIQELF